MPFKPIEWLNECPPPTFRSTTKGNAFDLFPTCLIHPRSGSCAIAGFFCFTAWSIGLARELTRAHPPLLRLVFGRRFALQAWGSRCLFLMVSKSSPALVFAFPEKFFCGFTSLRSLSPAFVVMLFTTLSALVLLALFLLVEFPPHRFCPNFQVPVFLRISLGPQLVTNNPLSSSGDPLHFETTQYPPPPPHISVLFLVVRMRETC